MMSYSFFISTSIPPGGDDVQVSEIKQADMCMDTLGHSAGGSVGMYGCHGAGGNQVNNATIYYQL